LSEASETLSPRWSMRVILGKQLEVSRMTKPPLSPISSVFCWQPVKLTAPAAITNTLTARAASLLCKFSPGRSCFPHFLACQPAATPQCRSDGLSVQNCRAPRPLLLKTASTQAASGRIGTDHRHHGAAYMFIMGWAGGVLARSDASPTTAISRMTDSTCTFRNKVSRAARSPTFGTNQ
jgi:hypothetical protein